MPFRLINLPLIMAGPHVVAVVHLLTRQRDLSLDLPIAIGEEGTDFYHADRAREVRPFPISQLILSIDPDFSNSLDAGFLCRWDDIAIKRGLKDLI